MSLDISQKNHDQIVTWKRLKGYGGFKLLVDELNEIIAESEKVIFATGADHKRVYTDRDMAIVKRDNAMRIKELPDRMVGLLSGTGESTPENPDAYGDQNETEDAYGDQNETEDAYGDQNETEDAYGDQNETEDAFLEDDDF